MENKQIAKQIIDFHKATFDNTFSSLSVMQEQTEKMVEGFIAQASWLPDDGKKAVKEWVNIYKKGRDDFKSAADKNYKKVEAFFLAAADKKEAATKPRATKSK